MISAVDIVMRELPLRQYQAMGRTSAHTTQESVFIRVTDEQGRCGVGEASTWPVFSGLSQSGLFAGLAELLGPVLLGFDEGEYARLDMLFHERVRGMHAATAAAQMAVLDLLARTRGEPMCGVFGGDRGFELALSYSVALQDLAAERDVVARLYAEGYRIFKLKTGVLAPARDVERLYALRELCPDAALRLDYNESGTEEALRAIHRPAVEVGVDYCEQPFPAGQDERLLRLRRWFTVPISLDEGVTSVSELINAAQRGLCEYVSLKSGKLGGPAQVAEMGRLAVGLGITPYAGSLSETRLGVSAAMAALSAVPGLAPGCDFYFPFLIVDDGPITGGPQQTAGTLRLPDGSGHGCTVPDEWWRDSSAVRLVLGG